MHDRTDDILGGYEWDPLKDSAWNQVPDHLGSQSNGVRARCIPLGKMKDEYDMTNAKRGAVVPTPPGKSRITIRLDDEILNWFRDRAEKAGGGSYQTMINAALRDYITSSDISERLRRVVREELERDRSAGR